ncbi:MAG: hypothetical protein U5L76_01175 [Patescibacteria group bacterium]|nr:hypothetical protein [Patescibacteria group bacterium]
MTKFSQKFQSQRRSRLAKPSFLSKLKISRQKLSVALFLCLIITGLAYLAVINNVSIRGFEIKELEKRVGDLKEENKNLEMKTAQLQSMEVIAQASKGLDLELAEKVEYLEVKAPFVVLKD